MISIGFRFGMRVPLLSGRGTRLICLTRSYADPADLDAQPRRVACLCRRQVPLGSRGERGGH